MHSAAIHLLRRVSREDHGAGVSPARLSALVGARVRRPQTISELAMMERVKVPTMSRLVAAMEEEALVRREPHGTDGRVVVAACDREGQADSRSRARACACRCSSRCCGGDGA